MIGLAYYSVALAEEPTPIAYAKGFAFIALEAHYVDGIVDPDAGVGTESSDASISLLLFGDRTLVQSKNWRWAAAGSLYHESYRDFGHYDIASANLNTALVGDFSTVQLRTKLGYTKIWLGGAQYLNENEGLLGWRWSLNGGYQVRAQFKIIDVSAAKREFERHEGDVYEHQLLLKQSSERINWSLDVTARNENRADHRYLFLDRSNTRRRGFTSYSRESIRWRVRADWNWARHWRQSVYFTRRHADYDNSDVFPGEDGRPMRLLRKTRQVNYETEMNHSLSPSLGLLLRYSHLEDNSNNADYDFVSRTVSLGLDWLY